MVARMLAPEDLIARYTGWQANFPPVRQCSAVRCRYWSRSAPRPSFKWNSKIRVLNRTLRHRYSVRELPYND